MACAVAREPQNFPCHSCDCLPDGTSRWGEKWKIKDVVESTVCFRKQLTEFSLLMLQLHRHYQNGVLPFSGGILEQSYIYFRAMTIIEQWITKDAGPDRKSRH